MCRSVDIIESGIRNLEFLFERDYFGQLSMGDFVYSVVIRHVNVFTVKRFP